MKITAKCPECGIIYKGSIKPASVNVTYPDEHDEIITLSEPCPYCIDADKAAKEMLGDLYVSIEERKER